MDFGLFNQFNLREGADYHSTLKEWLDLAVESEKIGMDSFWFGETHFRPNRSMLSSPLIGASAVAARTERIKVGTAVQVLPLAEPLRIAEEAAGRPPQRWSASLRRGAQLLPGFLRRV